MTAFLILLLLPIFPTFAAMTLTGDVDVDFATENCLEDEGGQDVGLPSGVVGSGFDIDKVCFFYDGSADDLYVGVSTVNDIIFGDADGNGDAGSSAMSGILDRANLGAGESFVISFDLDGDSQHTGFDANTVDVLIGISNPGSLNTLGAYDVAADYDPLVNPALGFGDTLLADVTLFATPGISVRDLEFVVHDFKAITEDSSNTVFLQIFAGSTVDAGIGEDYVPDIETSITHPVFDFDEDGLEDWQEVDEYGTDPTDGDSDEDGISDGTEVNEENPTDPLDNDSDDDSCADGTEDTNQNGVFEPERGETNPNDADTDDDGLSDCVELTGGNPTDPNDRDTDDDGLLDGEEDVNHNGVFEPELGETDPNVADTDGGGVADGPEVIVGTDPNDPSDDGAAAEQIAVGLLNQVQGGGFGCSLAGDSRFKIQNSKSNFESFLVLLFSGIFLLVLARRSLFNSRNRS